MRSLLLLSVLISLYGCVANSARNTHSVYSTYNALLEEKLQGMTSSTASETIELSRYFGNGVAETTFDVDVFNSWGAALKDRCGKRWLSRYERINGELRVTVNYLSKHGTTDPVTGHPCAVIDLATYRRNSEGLSFSGYERKTLTGVNGKVRKKVSAFYRPEWLILPSSVKMDEIWQQKLEVAINEYSNAGNLNDPTSQGTFARASTAAIVGTEDVKVKAGHFRKCIKVAIRRLSQGKHSIRVRWMCEKAGMVKELVYPEGADHPSMKKELVKISWSRSAQG